ncbi:MAG: hypothetical protein HN576_07430 [Bacteriovoracaceae bacterium]|jgi:hypothetical protein|nr:hypothetical protein [Bacteriovoracaceae bacterium]
MKIIIYLLLFSSTVWSYDYNDNNVTIDLHKKILNETFDYELSLINNRTCAVISNPNDSLDQETFKQVEIDLNKLRHDVIQCKESPAYAKFYLTEYIKLEKHYANQNNILKRYIQDKYSRGNFNQLDVFIPNFWSNLSSASMTLHKVRLSIDVLNDVDQNAYPECLQHVKKKNISVKYCKPVCNISLSKRLKYLEALKTLKPLVLQYWKKSWCQALLDKVKLKKVRKEQVFKIVDQSGKADDFFYNGARPSLYKGGAELINKQIKEKNVTPEATITMPKYISKTRPQKTHYYDLTRELYYNRLKTIERLENQGEKTIWRTISERYYKDFYPRFIKDN